MRVNRDFWRAFALSMRSFGGRRLATLALGSVAVAACAGHALAQGASEQQIRCLQLQQELASASQGGGANSDDLARLDQQIAQNDRVFQGTQAAMQDAGCFESFFIFGKALVRSPQCLKMNDRVEDARRQLAALQQQRAALSGGGGNKRRQAELQDALARSGCGGQVRAPRRGGGLFDFFGGGQETEEEQQPQTPIYRSIDPNGRYRSVCVRLCDGFFYPVSFSTYSSNLAQEAERCQSSCAAPAELYVYRNPGQEIEQAISLNGSAYMDLPVALKFRKQYVNGCSCKQAEYNPTAIEEANKRAEAEAASQPSKGKGKGKVAARPAAAPTPQAAATPPATGTQGAVEVTGSNEPANPQAPPAVPQAQKPPAPAPAPAAAAAPAQPAQAQASSAGQSVSGGQTAVGQSSVIKKKPVPPPQ